MNIGPAAYTELSKFLALAQGREYEAYMFSPAVDAAWHDLMRAPDRYDHFCSRAGVKPLGHVEAKGSGRIPWIEDYHIQFGRLPDIWFRDAHGVLNVELHKDYLSDRMIHACWDCHPLPTKEGFKPAKKPEPPLDDTESSTPKPQ